MSDINKRLFAKWNRRSATQPHDARALEVEVAGLRHENAGNENLLRFYISELKKTHNLVEKLITVLTDAHSYIEADAIRESVGTAIIVGKNFRVGK